MEDIKEKTADEIRKIAQEELVKQIRENIDSALIFKYISMIEEENKELKARIKMQQYRIQELDIPKAIIQEHLNKQYALFNSKNQKEYSQEVIDVLEEILNC